MEENKQNNNMEPLASEMYQDLKRTNTFHRWVIVVLILALMATNLYHIWQWSQFDTVVLDTSNGDGYANYVGGENTGGIYNGTDSGTPQEKPEQGQGVSN